MQATRTPIVKKLVTPFEEFFNAQAIGGMLLTVAAAAALVWANSPWSSQYFGLRDLEITLAAGPFNGHASIQHLINDGLMALFFFVVGLEIKRELLIGELTSARKAFLPVAAAVGGMAVPAAIFIAFNFGTRAMSGWAIPMATDIAFALGILSLFGHRIPISAKVFLTSVAIIDDLGAVAVIAMFYSKGLDLTFILSALALLLALIIFNRSGIQSTVVYVVFGIAVWFCFLGSGIHATVAGVLVAATIPVWSKIDPQKFSQISQIKLQQFADATDRTQTPFIDADQEKAIHELHSAITQVQPPMTAMQHALHPWSTFFIMPLFAFFNAGINFADAPLQLDGMTAGIVGGLFIGKPLGIVGGSYLAIKAGWAEKLTDLSRLQFTAVSMLAGVGFTMSLFIANLAFMDPEMIGSATGAVLVASFLSAIAGALMVFAHEKRLGKQSANSQDKRENS